jgi:membrane-bound serine protease (ClpP class)
VAACGSRVDTASGERGSRHAAHVRIQGPIDLGSSALLSRAIRVARKQGAETLIIELDTPGGLIDVMWGMQKNLLDAEENGPKLCCWVHEHAASAGALVALCCSSIYMSPGGTIGSAYPVA